jgi:hypothetical protein
VNLNLISENKFLISEKKSIFIIKKNIKRHPNEKVCMKNKC